VLQSTPVNANRRRFFLFQTPLLLAGICNNVKWVKDHLFVLRNWLLCIWKWNFFTKWSAL